MHYRHFWRLVDSSQRRYRSPDPADLSLFYEKSDSDSEGEGYRCMLIKVPVIFARKLARIRGSASSPCECLAHGSAVKRTNSLYFGVACNSAECIPLPATGRLFRIATISIYSGVIDCCYRLIQASLSSIFSSLLLSLSLSLSYLFVPSIRKRNVFDPRARKCTCLLYPQIARHFHREFLSLRSSSIVSLLLFLPF